MSKPEFDFYLYYNNCMEQKTHAEGKKTFLLYPHSVIRDDMLDKLIMAGYETYTILDEKRARKLLAKFPGSIMFVNIDEGLSEDGWERYILGIQSDPQTRESQLGIMSYNQDQKLMKKYLMEMAIPCGYILLKLGFQESTKIIINALEANEARGRRKCIRADCHDDVNATVNYKGETGVFRGKLMDISSVGIAVKFDKFESLPSNSLLKSVQLRLKGGLVLNNMVLMGQRHDDSRVYIMIFGPSLTVDDKQVIHHYIKECLQKFIDTVKI